MSFSNHKPARLCSCTFDVGSTAAHPLQAGVAGHTLAARLLLARQPHSMAHNTAPGEPDSPRLRPHLVSQFSGGCGSQVPHGKVLGQTFAFGFLLSSQPSFRGYT